MTIGKTVRLFNYGGEVELIAEIMNDKSFCVNLERKSGVNITLTNQEEVEKFLNDFNDIYARIKMELAK